VSLRTFFTLSPLDLGKKKRQSPRTPSTPAKLAESGSLLDEVGATGVKAGPFPNVPESNVDAVRPYQRLGFRLRLRTKLVIVAQP
jgi:hypothetical protein